MREIGVTGVQTCALPILRSGWSGPGRSVAHLLRPTHGVHGFLDRQDRKSVVQGTSVDLGGRRLIKKHSFARHRLRLIDSWHALVASLRLLSPGRHCDMVR